jgi:hypothetical protein
MKEALEMPNPTFPGAQAQLVNLDLYQVALCNEGANSRAHIVLTKRKENSNMPKSFTEVLAALNPEDADVVNKHIQGLESAKDTTINGLQTTITDLQKKVNTPPAPVAEPSFEDLMKNADPKTAALIKSLKEANERLVAEQADSLAKSRYEAVKAIPVEEATLKDLLKTASPAMYDVLVKAAEAVTKTALADPVGKSVPTDGAPITDSYAKLEKSAKDIQKSNTGMSFEQAFTQACNENPTVYADYVKGESK